MWSLWEGFHFCRRRNGLYLGHWVLISLCYGNQGWERGGCGGKKNLPWLPRVPRCSWASAQMQLEDEAAAKKSRAPCCSLRGGASLVHVYVPACAEERESDREHENVNETPCLCRVQGTGENVQRAPIILRCSAPADLKCCQVVLTYRQALALLFQPLCPAGSPTPAPLSHGAEYASPLAALLPTATQREEGSPRFLETPGYSYVPTKGPVFLEDMVD